MRGLLIKEKDYLISFVGRLLLSPELFQATIGVVTYLAFFLFSFIFYLRFLQNTVKASELHSLISFNTARKSLQFLCRLKLEDSESSETVNWKFQFLLFSILTLKF